jgi:cytochrome c-type biogenesis protein CcmF
VAGYDFTFQGIEQETLANGDVVQKVSLDLARGGSVIGRIQPTVTQLANRAENQSTRFNAAVHVEPLRDVFLAFQGGDASGLSFDAKINPLISWAWAGFLITVIGTAIAAWPRKETPVPAAPAPSPKRKKAA